MYIWKRSDTKNHLYFEHECRFGDEIIGTYTTKERFDEIYEDESEQADFYIVKNNNLYGVVNLRGEYLVPLEFDEIRWLTNGMILAKNSSGYQLWKTSFGNIAQECFKTN